MMSYINETDFVIENKELVYPEIVTDGLQLYYDAKGKRDTDYHRDTMLDMSGNKNHGHLQNFAYEKHSGYKDGLVFDYIDDKLVRPALSLQANDFTFMLNGNIISFSPDGTVKRVQNGEVIESKGFNLLSKIEPKLHVGSSLNSSFRHESISLYHDDNYPIKGDLVYIRSDIEVDDDVTGIGVYTRDFKSGHTGGSANVPVVATRSQIDEIQIDGQDIGVTFRMQASGNNKGNAVFSNMMAINLTKTFGKGNEPTLEQADEIYGKMGATPNPNVLMSTTEYKGNDLGDMENIIDGLYKTEVLSGEEIYTDKADDAVIHVDVDGKSAGGGSGKNIMQGYQTLNRMSEHADMNNLPRFKVEKNKKYQLSHQPVVGATKWRLWIKLWKDGVVVRESSTNLTKMRASGFYFNGNTNIYLNGGDWNTTHISLEFYDDYEVAVAISSGDTILGNYALNPQMELGEEKTDYEPPAPTPDYPIEIHSLNDFDVVSSVGRENLIGKSNIIKGGWISDTGALQINLSMPRVASDFIEIIPGSDMTFTYDGYDYIGSSTKKVMGVYDKDKIFIERLTSTVIDKVWKIKLNNQAKFVRLAYGTSSSEYDNYAKLEVGSESTPWNYSHKDLENNLNNNFIDKINLLLDEPLRSVGDIKDRLFRDSDGVWKVERNVGESVYDGSDDEWWNFQTSGTTYNRWALTNDTGKNDFNRETILSSHFNMMVGNNNTPWHGFESRGAIYLYVSMDSDLVTTPTWRAWLSENPVTVLRKLAEPHVEILSQSLQDKLNNLRSFEDSNYVYTALTNENNYISENLKPTLHAKFLYNNWYKEDRVINNLMIYNRALTNEEILQNYKTIKRRWGM